MKSWRCVLKVGILLLSPLVLFAQQNGGAWTNIGPSPAAVKAIAVDPRGAGTILMGTLGGGVRKCVDGGIAWPATAAQRGRLFQRFPV